MWPLITGENTTSPRTEWMLSPPEVLQREPAGGVGYMRHPYKLIITTDAGICEAGWCGPFYPNNTKYWSPTETKLVCTHGNKSGCLFDVFADPTEQHDLASE